MLNYVPLPQGQYVDLLLGTISSLGDGKKCQEPTFAIAA